MSPFGLCAVYAWKDTVPRDPLFSYTTNRYLSGHCVFHSRSRRIPERADDTDEKHYNLYYWWSCGDDWKYRGFTAFLTTIHCIVHRQNLVAQNITEPLNSAMDIVIKYVNKIKAHPLNSRLFKQLCSENDEEFERLLLHTEVRWLSKGICLNRVFCNFSSVVEFLDTVYIPLAGKVNKIQDQVAYLADIFLESQWPQPTATG